MKGVFFLPSDPDSADIDRFVSVLDSAVMKHQGPGAHPGTGTPQEAHAGAGRVNVAQPMRGARRNKAPVDWKPETPHRMGVAEATAADPALEAKLLSKMRQVAGFEGAESLDEVVDTLANNLVELESRADPSRAAEWAEWYPKANEMNARIADEHGVDPDTVHAVMARLSPQADWADNMAMGEEVVRIFSEDPVIGPADMANHRALQLSQAEGAGRRPEPALDDLTGKRFSELDEATAAQMIRPLSMRGGLLAARNVDGSTVIGGEGEPRQVRWQTYDNLERSVSILRDPSFRNVDYQLGAAHKIRAFYNNMRDPHDRTYGEVTIDTHAYGAALGIPVTTASTEITTAKGSITLPGAPNSTKAGTKGAYPVFVEAYRRAANQLGYSTPRALQSVAWEQWKAEWPKGARDSWMVSTVRNVVSARSRGEISRSDAAQIIESFRVQLPGVGSIMTTNQPERIVGSPVPYIGAVEKALAAIEKGLAMGRIDSHINPGIWGEDRPEDEEDARPLYEDQPDVRDLSPAAITELEATYGAESVARLMASWVPRGGGGSRS